MLYYNSTMQGQVNLTCTHVPWHIMGLCGMIPLCTTHALAEPNVPSCTLVPWYIMGLCGTIPLCTAHALYSLCGMIPLCTAHALPTVYHMCCYIAHPNVPSCTLVPWYIMVRSHCVPHMLFIAHPIVPSCTHVPWYIMGLCGMIPLCTTHALAHPNVPSCTHVPWYIIGLCGTIPLCTTRGLMSHPVLLFHGHLHIIVCVPDSHTHMTLVQSYILIIYTSE